MTHALPDLPTGVRRVLAATDPWTARDTAEELLELGEPGEPNFELWNDLLDVYEHGEVSARAAWSVLRAACQQWLDLDEDGRRAFEEQTAARGLDDLLREQGHRRSPQPDRVLVEPWWGCWDEVQRHVSNVEATGSPYMAAVGVLAALADEPARSAPYAAARGDELAGLVGQWRVASTDRETVDLSLLDLLRSYRSTTVPPFIDEAACEAAVTALRRAGCDEEVRVLLPSHGPELTVVLAPQVLAGLDLPALEEEIGKRAGRRARLIAFDGRATARLGGAGRGQSVAGSSSP